MAQLFFGDILTRAQDVFEAKPTGDNQLSVGLGGDIPVFPPLLVVVLVALGFLAKAVLPPRPVLPEPLRKVPLRVAFFAAGLAFMFSTINACEEALRAAGHGVNFAAIPAKTGLVTSGPFTVSRNPIYAAGCLVVGPAVAVLANSQYMVVALSVLPAYLHWIVIPAEEALLGRLMGNAYADYLQAVPRWLF